MSKVLFTLTPITGHVRPALPIVRALVDAGHDVDVYTGSKFAGAVEATGARYVPMTLGRDEDDSDVSAWSDANGAPGPGLRRLRWEVVHLFVRTVPAYVDDVSAYLAAEQPDVAVVESAFVAGALAARRHGVPSVQLSVLPLQLSGRDVPPFGPGLQPPRHALDRLKQRALTLLIQKVVFRDAQREAQLVAQQVGAGDLDVFFFDWVGTIADRLLQASVPGFEYPRLEPHPELEFVGQITPRGVDAFDEPAWWSDVLAAREAGRPVVLVTQGTIATDPDRLLRPTLEGLADQDVLVVATTAIGEPDEVVPDRPANVRAARFVPFEHLLPLVDVMVTNGGFGGVQQALAHGVPLVVAGRTEDKAEVTARVVWSGTGVGVRTDAQDVASAAAVRSGVLEVLADPSYRRRATELAAEYARYDAVARTVEVVEETARERATVGA